MKHKIMIITLTIITTLVIGIFIALNHPSFGRLPQGERLERIKKSPNYRNGKFENIEPTIRITSNRNKLQQIWNLLTAKKSERLKPNKAIKAVKTDLKHLDPKEDLMIWFGHSSYLLQTGGKRFLIDPILTNEYPMSLKFEPFEGTDIYSPEDMPKIDFLIITHDHWDHLDYNTVKRIRNKVDYVVCPLGVGEHLEYWEYPVEKIIEMDWNETYKFDNNLKINCLPTRHFSGRFLTENPTLWASFMIESEKNVFIGGDSGYGKHFKKIGERFNGIDLAIMENGQYDKDWKHIHTMPSELSQAIEDLKAEKVITVHHNKYALARHPWDEPEKEIEKHSKGKKYQLLKPIIGEVCKY